MEDESMESKLIELAKCKLDTKTGEIRCPINDPAVFDEIMKVKPARVTFDLEIVAEHEHARRKKDPSKPAPEEK